MEITRHGHAKQKVKIKAIWQVHPWWQKGMQHGYTEFIAGDELDEWKPIS